LSAKILSIKEKALIMYYFFIAFLCNFIFFPFAESKEKVHIVSYNGFLVPAEETYLKFERVREEYDVTFFVDLYKYVDNFVDSEDLYKVIFIDFCWCKKLQNIPKHKLMCWKWEAPKENLHKYNSYSRVYTFDDDLIDEKKFFKFCYPVLQPMVEDLPDFKERKLCTMIAGNWGPPERIGMLDFFASKPLGDFEFYGLPPKKYQQHPMAKGLVHGFSSSKTKLHTIKQYRFCVCFENTHTTMGYITEKIFDVFASGCIPVYWGPKNVTDFIPLNCFIDYRMFHNNEEMYEYLQNFTEEQFNEYLKNIKAYLQSEQAKLFSSETFEDILLEALKTPYIEETQNDDFKEPSKKPKKPRKSKKPKKSMKPQERNKLRLQKYKKHSKNSKKMIKSFETSSEITRKI